MSKKTNIRKRSIPIVLFNVYIRIFLNHYLLQQSICLIDVHSVRIIEIDKDRNSIVRPNDDSNIVEEYEHVEYIRLPLLHLLNHQQTTKNAKNEQIISERSFLQ